jgi:hypothetical protein
MLRISRQHLARITLHLILFLCLVGCGVDPRVSAEERLFLDINLEFLDEFVLPKQSFQGTTVGGLSAIAYDRKRDRYYVLSDDRSRNAPARFYTFNIPLAETESGEIKIQTPQIEAVTYLRNTQGETFPLNSLDPEGLALSPRNTILISSEGIPKLGVNPFISEFDLASGQSVQNLRIPQRYLPDPEEHNIRGVRENQGLEALAVFPRQGQPDDPFRLFAATEGALYQDSDRTTDAQTPLRLLHYGINTIGDPILIAEHLYLLDPPPTGAVSHGLSELLALDREGYWLTLERSYGLLGSQVKIFQAVTAGGTDTSRILAFQNNLASVTPIQKRLVLDLDRLNLDLDNLEGMALGPRLADGNQTLILVSDDNFNPQQKTQFLLFKLRDRP